MDCQQVRLTLSAFLDDHVVESERRSLASHLRQCPDCSRLHQEMVAIRESVRSVPVQPVPQHLAYMLRVSASKEASRRRRYAGLAGWVRDMSERAELFANNLMRPLALPAAGGIASAFLLFSMVLTNYQGIVRRPVGDVPTILATDAQMKSALFGAEDEISVDVLVDEQGRAIDYQFHKHVPALSDAALRRRIENSLLFARFTPATTFGQPISGWVRVSFRRSEIDVKG